MENVWSERKCLRQVKPNGLDAYVTSPRAPQWHNKLQEAAKKNTNIKHQLQAPSSKLQSSVRSMIYDTGTSRLDYSSTVSMRYVQPNDH